MSVMSYLLYSYEQVFFSDGIQNKDCIAVHVFIIETQLLMFNRYTKWNVCISNKTVDAQSERSSVGLC